LITQVNRVFVRQLLSGEKKAFRLSQVLFIEVPLYPELGVKQLVAMAREDPKVCLYLRDKFWEGKPPTRSFLINIINTVNPGYFEYIIDDQSRLRNIVSQDQLDKDAIMVSPEFHEALLAHPFTDG
jgi:hypothetical protein